jgi:hypothetical protein
MFQLVRLQCPLFVHGGLCALVIGTASTNIRQSALPDRFILFLGIPPPQETSDTYLVENVPLSSTVAQRIHLLTILLRPALVLATCCSFLRRSRKNCADRHAGQRILVDHFPASIDLHQQ